MKRFLLFLITLVASAVCFSQEQGIASKLVPLPVSLSEGAGSFTISNKTAIHIASADAGVRRVANFLSTNLKSTGLHHTGSK